MTDVYVFDLDGTLTDHSRRIPLAPGRFDGDWQPFQEDAINDPPIEGGLRLALALQKAGELLVFMTSRDKNSEQDTFDWIVNHGLEPTHLYMREVRCLTPAHLLKQQWLEELPDWMWPVAIFEDNCITVNHLREAGYCVYQISNGGDDHDAQQTISSDDGGNVLPA